MALYWIVYSKKTDEKGNLAPKLVEKVEREAGLHSTIIANAGTDDEQILLLSPKGSYSDYVIIRQKSMDGEIKLDLIYDEAAHRKACLKEIRVERGRRLKESDWAMLVDIPMYAKEKDAWKAYRQALRNIPQTSGLDPRNEATYSWPKAPDGSY